MKLDVNVLRYLSQDDFRVLVAVELGMCKHEIVPSTVIARSARLKHGGTYKVLKNLLKNKLLHHDSSEYDGFRLTYLGYDFLAIKALVDSGLITAVGRQIGVGKESDIFEVVNEEGRVMAMKLHRLGRVSFRAVKTKRDYLGHKNDFNWLYLSRVAARKEFAFMKALGDHGFPVPEAVGRNRHCVVMSLVQGYPLAQVQNAQNPDAVFETVIGLIVRLAEHGLIHCDFNEFNIMIDEDENVTMIDFPQMVSVNHPNAKMYFDRDVECIFKFFRKRLKLTFELRSDEVDARMANADDNSSRLNLSSITKAAVSLDKELSASGWVKGEQDDFDRFIETCDVRDSDDDELKDDELAVADITKLDSLELTKQEESEEESEEEICPRLIKSLGKQREKAIASARRSRQSHASRNSYKDKGGKSSRSSSIFNQSSDW